MIYSVCACVRVCVCVCVCVCVYTHIHICVVVFCPDSNQEHVDHAGKEKGHGSVYLRAHVRFCVCAYV